jgi:hypothetical protein
MYRACRKANIADSWAVLTMVEEWRAAEGSTGAARLPQRPCDSRQETQSRSESPGRTEGAGLGSTWNPRRLRHPKRNPTIGRRSARGRCYTLAAMRDTSEPALERYYELLRSRTPLARITTAVQLSAAVRELAEAAIRAEDPEASATVVRARLASRLYGREIAARLFPGVQLDVR